MENYLSLKLTTSTAKTTPPALTDSLNATQKVGVLLQFARVYVNLLLSLVFDHYAITSFTIYLDSLSAVTCEQISYRILWND